MIYRKNNILLLVLFTILIFGSIYCEPNYSYAKQWKWKSNSSYQGNRFNQFTAYKGFVAFADLPQGIDIKDNSTVWSIEIPIELTDPINWYCFGIYNIENFSDAQIADKSLHMNSISACTDGTIVNNMGSSSYIVNPFPFDKLYKGKYDMILNDQNQFIISNERYGKNTRIEFQIDSNIKYFPFIESGGSTNDSEESKININACSDKCNDCLDWVLDECISCKYISNVQEAPSCECLPGFTHYYNNQSNTDCQINPDYHIPSPQEYQWQSSEIPDQNLVQLGLFSYPTGTPTYIQHWVELENGIQQQKDGIKWTIQILEGADKDPKVCFGIIDKEQLGQPTSGTSSKFSKSMSICTQGDYYDYNSQNTTINGILNGIYTGCIGQKYDIIFTDTTLTITSIPYYGTTDIVFEYDNTKQYVPYLEFQHWEARAKVAACSPRCQECEYFNPVICTVCSDSENRKEIPNCQCKDGKQDIFRIPINHLIQSNCINDYIYYEIGPLDWQWKSYNNVSTQIQGGTYQTVDGTDYFTVDLGYQGIKMLNDGVKWSVKLTFVDQDKSQICIGIQKTTITTSNDGAYICTDGLYKNYTGYYIDQKKDPFPQYSEATGKIFDLIYFGSHLIITDESYGGNVRYELELNPNINYSPRISVDSENVLRQPVFQVYECNQNCKTCQKFEPQICLSCNDQSNRSSAPNCICNAGLEDVYEGIQQKICRQKPEWKLPSPPEWIWTTQSPYLEENIDIGDNVFEYGTFKSTSNGHGSIRVQGYPTIENYTKWTVKIKKHNSRSKVCFGILHQTYHDLDWKSTSQYSKTITQCSNGENNTYNFDGLSGSYYVGQLNGPEELDDQQFDLFYEKHKLTINNLNYGGSFERVFPLDSLNNYTPIIYVYRVLTVIQVKGCSKRCKTCVDFEPTNCLLCSTLENRIVAPSCECSPNYSDILQGQLQDVCILSEYYKEKKSPEWQWVSALDQEKVTQDIENGAENYGTYKNNVSYASYFVKDTPVLENYTSWTVKILEHSQTGKMCFGVSEAQQFLTLSNTTYEPSKLSCFATNNSIYNQTGKGSNFIVYDMPSNDRDSLNGEIFELFYKRDKLIITNENYNGMAGGRKIKAELSLNPGLTYVAYVDVYGSRQKIQFKGCSKRCKTCVDWQPRQCIICNDQLNRNTAPCCGCKSGFNDQIQNQIQEICYEEKNYKQFKFSEWQWVHQVSNLCSIKCGEDMQKRGQFLTIGYDMNIYLSDQKVLNQPTKWQVKILSHTEDGKMCFGIMSAYLNLGNESFSKSESVCTDGNDYVEYANSNIIFENFPTDRTQNIGVTIDLIFEPELLTITSDSKNGGINAQFVLDPYQQYSPYITIDGDEDQIQVLHCNLNCKTCKDWFPDICYSCQGQNRVGMPTCGCKKGYTDFYQNQYQVDCIPIQQYTEEHPHPNDWVYKFSNIDNIIDLGNGLFKNHYSDGIIYVDLGKEGIKNRLGGTKWSIEINNFEHTLSYICIGVITTDSLPPLINNPNDNFNCLDTLDTGYNQISSSEALYKMNNVNYDITDFIGSRFDILYDEGYLRITDQAYGGFKDYEWKLFKVLNFIPCIYTKSYSRNEIIINTKPCHFKCKSCDNSISTKQCTECSDTLTRNEAPDCSCKPGYYENPDGYFRCSACKAPCFNCANEITCLSCIIQSNRKNNAPDCGCEAGYYNTINNNCEKCDYKCSECQNNPTKCTVCKNEPSRNQVTCECLEGFYESKETQSCLQCPSSCKSCIDGSGVCLECACDRIGSQGQGGICTCPINSYGLAQDESQCLICQAPCATCTNITTCKSCLSNGAYRQPAPSCECQESFFEDEYGNCRACMKGCQICAGYSFRCQQCVQDPNRNQDTSYCNCKEGFIDSPITGMCVEDVCMPKCASCVPGNSTQCADCANTHNRKPLDKNCDCNEGYFDDGTIECKKCPYPCQECLSPTICVTCITTLNRNFAPYCTCKAGSFEDSSQNCIQCAYRCQECQTEANNCTSCKIEPNRQTSGLCNCESGFVENPITYKCEKMTTCSVKCDTCQQSNKQICTSCIDDPNSNRKSLEFNCVCKDTFYEADLKQCQPCVHPCKTCESQSYCKECSISGQNRHNIPKCTCIEGYVEDFDKNCILAPTGCPVQEGRSQDNDCLCLDGYFENDQGNCQKCKDGCGKCKNDSDCQQCADGFKQDSLPDCNVICDIVCADCGEKASECTRCAEGRHQPPECPCLSSYYDEGQQPQCYQCDDQCESCQNQASNCTVCKGSLVKRYNAPNCSCWEGYYQNSYNNNECEACDFKCLTCVGRSDNCLVCRPGIDRILTAPSCSCKLGTYPTPYNNNCEFCSSECQASSNRRLLFTEIIEQPNLQCDSKCKSCDMFSMQCLVCLPGKNTTMVPPKCECLKGYYQDQETQECYKCQEECEECQTQNQCSSCRQQDMVVNIYGQCQCKQNTIYNKKTRKCSPCYYYQGKCVLQCPKNTGTLDNESYQCISSDFKKEFTNKLDLKNYQSYGYIALILIITIGISKFLFSLL